MNDEIKNLVKDFVQKHNIRDKEVVTDVIKIIQKAQELLSDRMFTLEDVVKIVHIWDNHININEEDKGSIRAIQKFIESLSQKSWNVELEMEYVGSNNDGSDIYEPIITNGKFKVIKIC